MWRFEFLEKNLQQCKKLLQHPGNWVNLNSFKNGNSKKISIRNLRKHAKSLPRVNGIMKPDSPIFLEVSHHLAWVIALTRTSDYMLFLRIYDVQTAFPLFCPFKTKIFEFQRIAKKNTHTIHNKTTSVACTIVRITNSVTKNKLSRRRIVRGYSQPAEQQAADSAEVYVLSRLISAALLGFAVRFFHAVETSTDGSHCRIHV